MNNSNIKSIFTAIEESGINKTILFIAAHPDDIEFFASYLCMESVERGFEVHQLLSCCDEYGTAKNDFKGKRIRKIRRAEMNRAAQTYSNFLQSENKVNLHWMDYIDGHVPYNANSVKRMEDFILKTRPSIIVGPDPVYCFDRHRDHIATAKNFLSALRNISERKRDSLPGFILLYQTLFPNIFLDITKEKRKGCLEAWHAHKSQNDIITEIFWKLKHLLYLPCIIEARSGLKSEGYRRINFLDGGKMDYFNDTSDLIKTQHKKRTVKNILCFRTARFLFRFIFSRYSFGDMDENLFSPTPSELDLELNPSHPII